MKKILLPLLLLMLSKIGLAQPFSLDDRIQPIQLNLVNYKKSDTLKKGRINITEVTQTKDTLYYFVKDLSIYSPIYFSVTTKDETGNIRVSLCKDNWKTVNREGATGPDKHWEAQFKTEGDFGIMVVTENKPAQYTLLIWVGDEAKDVGVTSVFKDGSADADSGIGAKIKDNLLYIIIGLLVVIVALLFLKLKRK